MIEYPRSEYSLHLLIKRSADGAGLRAPAATVDSQLEVQAPLKTTLQRWTARGTTRVGGGGLASIGSGFREIY